MAGKAPRPNKNSDGQKKGAAQNPTGGAAAAPPAQGPPSLVPPGGPPSMQDLQLAQQMQQQAQQAAQQQQMQSQQTQQQHGNAMQMQQLKGQQALQQAAQQPGGAAPAPQAPPGADQGINPSQWPNNQVRESMNFKDLPPMGQAQVQEQEGINPAAPLQMIQSQLQSSLAEPGGPQGGPQQGPVPASFSGPMTPPGVEGFPKDLAALTQVMQRGMAPGADNGEHQMAMNAHAMAKAAVMQSQNSAAQNAHVDGIHQAIGGLLQHLQMAGQLPHPADVADTMRRHAGAPQVASSY